MVAAASVGVVNPSDCVIPPTPEPDEVDVRFMVPPLTVAPDPIMICPLPLLSAVVVNENVLLAPADEDNNVTEPLFFTNESFAADSCSDAVWVITYAFSAPMDPPVEVNATAGADVMAVAPC